MKHYLLLFLFVPLCAPAVCGQTYTTHYQGSNNNACGAYVAPIVTKTYGSNSQGYQAPARTSYSSSSYNSSSYATFSSKKSGNSSSSDEPTYKPQPKGKIYKAQDGKYGIEDGYGKKLGEAIYDEAGDFSQFEHGVGLYWVKAKGKYGIVDPLENKVPVPIIYDELKRISYGYALVKVAGKYGVVEINLTEDKSEVTIPIIYDDMGSMDGYDIWVKLGDKYGLISRDNVKHISVEYQDINNFSFKGHIVKKNDKMGIVNIRDEVVVPLEYDYITQPTNGMAWIYKDKKWGLINYKTEILAKPQYDTVFEQNDGKIWIHDLAVVSKGGNRIYVSTDGQELPFTNETAAKAAIKAETEMEEIFDEGNEKYKWPANAHGKIVGGSYSFTPTKNKDEVFVYANFPPEFSFAAYDDWTFEMKMKMEVGWKLENYGLEFGGDNEVRLLFANNMAYITGVQIGHVDVKLKNGYNHLKLVKATDTIEVYLNSKLIGSGKIKVPEAGSFRFVADAPFENRLTMIGYDDIKFHITKQGGNEKPVPVANTAKPLPVKVVVNNMDTGYTNVSATCPVPFHTPEYKYGFKDRNGKTIVAPGLYDANRFFEGLAAVKIKVYECGYMDTTGQVVISADYKDAHDFGEGVAAVKKGDKWGFIDRSGSKVLAFKYDNAGRFHEGICPVKKGDEWGYINKSGDVVIPYKKMIWAYSFSGGRAGYREDTLVGFIDGAGKMAIPYQYKSIQDFSEGLAGVLDLNKKWGFIDSTGAQAIAQEYDAMPISFINQYIFSEGLAAVKKGPDWMFINRKGTKVISLPKDLKDVFPFENGKSKIVMADKEYYINRKGEIVP